MPNEFTIKDISESKLDGYIKYVFWYIAGVASYFVYFMLTI